MFDKLSFRHIVFAVIAWLFLGRTGDILGEYNARYEEILGMSMVYTPLFALLIVIFEECYEGVKMYLEKNDKK